MSLKKNIILSFLISSAVIAILVITATVNFIEIKKEIRYLELSDSVRSKSLQLRRHEKNFFLYKDMRELEGAHLYLRDLKELIRGSRDAEGKGKLQNLKGIIDEYSQRLNRIEIAVWEFHKVFNTLKPAHPQYAVFFPLIESTFLERPIVNAELIEKIFDLREGAPIVRNLRDLNNEIIALRKNGEEILSISKDLDRSAREKVDHAVGLLQTAVLILSPLFLVVGLSTLFMISQSVVKRLKILTAAVEKTARGDFLSLAVPEQDDEVGVLIQKFNIMETQLAQREEELNRKNKELLQSKKLAAIGTLASGVAHELNNPLNNIYISAQILEKEAGDSCSPMVREILDDIVGQTVRVKKIVGDLLEYARGKEPRFAEVELHELIRGVYNRLKLTMDTEQVNFVLNSTSDKIMIKADREQLERVFINLFTNAIEAMAAKGDIIVTVKEETRSVKIWVSDTGKGMRPEEMEKVFEPFFTTKDKGTGLGLAIVFNIVSRHSGEIFVDSEKDKGTTFYLVFPLAEAAYAA